MTITIFITSVRRKLDPEKLKDLPKTIQLVTDGIRAEPQAAWMHGSGARGACSSVSRVKNKLKREDQ